MFYEKTYTQIFTTLNDSQKRFILNHNARATLSHQKKESGKPQTFLHRKQTISLEIFPSIFTPRGMTAEKMTYWILEQKRFFKKKSVLDIFCGCGVQGIAALFSGAGEIVFSDIQEDALKNSRINVWKNGYETIPAQYILSNVFSKIPEKPFDIILANYPFFSSETHPKDTHKKGITSKKGQVIDTFFSNAHHFLKPGGILICPYWWGAGIDNSPKSKIAHSKTLILLKETDLPNNDPMAIHKNVTLFLLKRK